MINILLVCILTLSSFAADITALKKEKEAFKAQKSNKAVNINHKVDENENRIIIIFYKNAIFSISDIETIYGLVFEKCLVNRVCIFRKNSNISLNSVMKKMKSELSTIEEIRAYKKHKFKQY